MSLRRTVAKMLEEDRLDDLAAKAEEEPGIPALLMRGLYHADAHKRWRAADAIGRASARVWPKDPERVLNLMQRMVWTLNDESGATGWGVPQAMGEVVRNDPKLAQDYVPLLISYLSNEHVYLGTDILVQGTLYALGRVGDRYPDAVSEAIPAVEQHLEDPDPIARGLAAWALGRMGASDCVDALQKLVDDDASTERYDGGRMVNTRVGDVVREALQRIS